MRIVAHTSSDDPLVAAGAAVVCGLSGLLPIVQGERLRSAREASGLNPQSHVLVINSEGATDPEGYSRMTRREIGL